MAVRALRGVLGVARAARGVLLIALGLGIVAIKAWTEFGGPYLEALPPYPYCTEAEAALDAAQLEEALELAEAGDCADVVARSRRAWDDARAVAGRCWEGVWTGRGSDLTALGCAVASDLVVFGDARDLTLQGLAWSRGEVTDPVLIALSTAGIALTFAPQVAAGNAVFKVARRGGTLSNALAGSVSTLARQRAWRPLAAMASDAGRIGVKLGPARGARALAYADTPAELQRLARFVDTARSPLLALRWGGKRAAALSDEVLYAAAMARGPASVRLAVERGSRALLSRKPLLLTAVKAVYKEPEAVAMAALALAAWLLQWPTWPLVLTLATVLVLAGAVQSRWASPPSRRGRSPKRPIRPKSATARRKNSNDTDAMTGV
jgi:hypothetical protein